MPFLKLTNYFGVVFSSTGISLQFGIISAVFVLGERRIISVQKLSLFCCPRYLALKCEIRAACGS